MTARVLVLVLLLSTALVELEAAPGQQRVGEMLRRVTQHATAVGDLAKRAGSTALLTMLLAMPLTGAAEAAKADDGKWWGISGGVKAPDEMRGVFYVLAKGATHAEQPFREVVYVGQLPAIGAMLIGNHLGTFVDSNMATEFALYDNDGLVLDNLEFKVVTSIPTPARHLQTDIYAVKGLDLSSDYTPLSIGMFPIDQIGEELLVVSYRHWFHEGVHGGHHDLDAVWRSCEVTQGGWHAADIGASNCYPAAAAHAAVFSARTLQLVGFHGGSNKLDPIHVGGISDALIVMMRIFGVAIEAMDSRAVPADKKMLATTWGRLKSE